MSTQKVLVNDTVRIRVKFADIDPSTLEEVAIEPVLVVVTITDSESNEIISENAEQQDGSSFYYDFIPTQADTYNVKFTGTLDNGNSVIVQQKLYVSSISEDYKPTVTLLAEEVISFSPGFDPLYLDPETLIPYFPEATLLEIGEIVHQYSIEVKKLMKYRDDIDTSDLPYIVYSYIHAATACDLTRTYGFGGDDEMSITLGDLTVNNKNSPRNRVSRDNASTWCQIAAALRKELIASNVSSMAIQPRGLPDKFISTDGKVVHPDTGKIIYLSDRDLYGPGRKISRKDDPMPTRGLRSYD